jgi:hypothetical protein
MAVGGYEKRMWRLPFGRRRLSTIAVAALAVLAFAGSAPGATSRADCGAAVLDDWTRGMLGSGYAPECYERAIDALPEDLRAYTTAADDITRAGIAASRAADRPSVRNARRLADTSAKEEQLRTFPTEVAVLGGVLAVVLPIGLAAALIRRWHTR